jgi:hypothetical protein
MGAATPTPTPTLTNTPPHDARVALRRGSTTNVAAMDEDDEDVWDELVGYAGSKLAANTALAPFESASVLLQVQYQPRARDPASGALLPARDGVDDAEDGGDVDRLRSASAPSALNGSRVPEAGYLPERPTPSLPVLDGVLHGVRMLREREGWLALWNGAGLRRRRSGRATRRADAFSVGGSRRQPAADVVGPEPAAGAAVARVGAERDARPGRHHAARAPRPPLAQPRNRARLAYRHRPPPQPGASAAHPVPPPPPPTPPRAPRAITHTPDRGAAG